MEARQNPNIRFDFQTSSSAPCIGYPNSTTVASTTRRRVAKRLGPRWLSSRNTWALLSRDLILTRDFGWARPSIPPLLVFEMMQSVNVISGDDRSPLILCLSPSIPPSIVFFQSLTNLRSFVSNNQLPLCL